MTEFLVIVPEDGWLEYTPEQVNNFFTNFISPSTAIDYAMNDITNLNFLLHDAEMLAEGEDLTEAAIMPTNNIDTPYKFIYKK